MAPLTLFKQQRLPAWQPLFSLNYIVVSFVLLGAVFGLIGIVLSSANVNAKEIVVRYDQINRCTLSSHSGAFAYRVSDEHMYRTGCLTEVPFEVTSYMKAPVYLYYGLSNFYQNHRRFVNSKSDKQLAGHEVSMRSLEVGSPLAYPWEERSTVEEFRVGSYNYSLFDFVYSPAGLIPWSMFNDTFLLYRVASDTERQLLCNSSAFSRLTNKPLEAVAAFGKGCIKKSIAWSSDVKEKYKPIYFPPYQTHHGPPLRDRAPYFVWSASPSAYGQNASATSDNVYFENGWYNEEPGHAIPVSTDEDLMVWARAASMPKFRKLHRILNQDLSPGKYIMVVGEHYDVSSFNGEKFFVLSTLSWIGGSSLCLQKMYLYIAAASLISAVVFFFLSKQYKSRAVQAVEALSSS
ncbi:hypothetical protein STCU_01422 [Strigomonas culicis]|uniref:LEM3 (Ligand-effect modulator 3) family / CDC50 family n=1 Tax=Strigomonas culicis TaxID=28005 RepID=S9WG26_9TRYP|nr:hypothetical protein STCU_01422 [Strigomonas culicis]|eukprot:EPY34680.1 hypothetical protein STCU_01422 [Strigomonas culicis]